MRLRRLYFWVNYLFIFAANPITSCKFSKINPKYTGQPSSDPAWKKKQNKKPKLYVFLNKNRSVEVSVDAV